MSLSPRLVAMYGNVDEAIKLMEFKLISPTRQLLSLKERQVTMPASSLLMCTNKCSSDTAHFVRSNLSSHVAGTIRSKLNFDLRKMRINNEHDGKLYQAVLEVMFNKKRISGAVR